MVVDPLVSFTHLTILIRRYRDISRFLAHELAPMPSSLFKDKFMRKLFKLSFSNALEKILPNYKNEKMIEHDHSILYHEENNEKLDDSCDESKEENNIL